ncbi:hypothetical protein Vadar_003997 [Vaccinium darrowii]|uniref:Uncharacterized protein n=1 Tax=Vaccinium darrowii TaxID=229202 RepID=A0ACB7XX72_9ERIC|nr:hypothetical protein Vadar_003997 [Vaccinium darrowii]
MSRTENEAKCYDVYGFDKELLEMVPKLVLAVLFLYPMIAKTEEERILQDSERKGPGATQDSFRVAQV